MSDKNRKNVIWLPLPENEYEADWLEENFVYNYYSSSCCMEEEASVDKETKLFPGEEQVVSFVQESSRQLLLLDIGCGRKGSLCHIHWQPRSCPLLWLGLDICADIVVQFQQTAKKPNVIVEGIVSSAYALPFREDIFDTILCQSVLHHCPTEYKRRLVWNNISKVTWTHSFCIYLTVCAFEQTDKRFASQDALVPDTKERFVFYHFFTKQQLEALVPQSKVITERDQHALIVSLSSSSTG